MKKMKKLKKDDGINRSFSSCIHFLCYICCIVFPCSIEFNIIANENINNDALYSIHYLFNIILSNNILSK